MDLALQPPEASMLLDALTEYQLEMIRRWASIPDVDAVFLDRRLGFPEQPLLLPVDLADRVRAALSPPVRRGTSPRSFQ